MILFYEIYHYLPAPSIIYIPLLQPILFAPAAVIILKSSYVLIPPAAFTPQLFPTHSLISLTFSALAPPLAWKPVLVLTKSALAAKLNNEA